MLIKPYYPVTLTIDGEVVVIRITRMTDEEYATFEQGYVKAATPTIEQFVSRAPDGPEQARDAKGAYVVSFQALCEHRLSTMGPGEREQLRVAQAKDEAEARAFMRQCFADYVTVERGISEETRDGKEVSVTTGLDFLRLFGARRDVLFQVIGAIHRENTVDAVQKKVSPSPSGSRTGFRPPPRARVGRRRATAAARAATGASAAPAAATATPARPSGSRAPSSRPDVPSVN